MFNPKKFIAWYKARLQQDPGFLLMTSFFLLGSFIFQVGIFLIDRFYIGLPMTIENTYGVVLAFWASYWLIIIPVAILTRKSP